MLAQVDGRLAGVQFEPRPHTELLLQHCTYNSVRTMATNAPRVRPRSDTQLFDVASIAEHPSALPVGRMERVQMHSATKSVRRRLRNARTIPKWCGLLSL
jgi:hypothetical protein